MIYDDTDIDAYPTHAGQMMSVRRQTPRPTRGHWQFRRANVDTLQTLLHTVERVIDYGAADEVTVYGGVRFWPPTEGRISSPMTVILLFVHANVTNPPGRHGYWIVFPTE
jgi:hypothetical protein